MSYVSDHATAGSFPIVQAKRPAVIRIDANDYAGVARAAANLRADIARVTGCTPELTTGQQHPGGDAIVVGTVGQSGLLRDLVKAGKLDLADIEGKWETFKIEVVPKAFGTNDALVIAGSDKRGAIFGVYDLSEQIGVSPWYWWADVPSRRWKPGLGRSRSRTAFVGLNRSTQ